MANKGEDMEKVNKIIEKINKETNWNCKIGSLFPGVKAVFCYNPSSEGARQFRPTPDGFFKDWADKELAKNEK